MKNKKKQMMISAVLIILLILAVIGVSYAAFSYIRTGEKVNQITTGTISMNYEESSNVIRITGALPTTDETGMKRLTDGEYFDFSVSTNLNGEAVINWEIAAEDFEDNTFDGSNVKFYLTKLDGDTEVPVSEVLPKVYSEEIEDNDKTGRPSNMMSLLVGSTQTQGEEVTNYRLRLYVDEVYNPQGDGGSLVFKTRINVYGKVSADEVPEKVQLPGMKRGFTSITYPARQITSLTVKRDINVPSSSIESWDASELNDDSVIVYVEESGVVTYVEDGVGKEAPGYKMTIGGKGGVMAPSNSSYLFYNFINLTAIDLKYFDTSNVTDMSYMFKSCYVNILDLSNFDTSNVLDMSYMFEGSRVINLDLSSFDTSKVTNMKSMFEHCTKLVDVNLASFNTSNVTNMNRMFYCCKVLPILDLTSFDCSNLGSKTNYMFFDCYALTQINVNDTWKNGGAGGYKTFQQAGVDHVTVV